MINKTLYQKREFEIEGIPSKNIVYVLTEGASQESPTYFCASCFENDSRAEQMMVSGSYYKCSRCGSTVQYEPDDPMDAITV